MIQTYKQIQEFVNNYNQSINDQYGQIQKLYSTPHLICIILRFKGISRYFYLGRGNHFEGIWEHLGPPPSEYRIRGRFLEYLRKHLVGAKISGLLLDDTDRILTIPYFQNKNKNFLAFFWKGRTLYFLNLFFENGKYKVFRSWIGKDEIFEKLADEKEIHHLFDSLGTGSVDLGKEGIKSSVMEYFQKLNKDLTKISFTGKKKKFFERKEEKILNDLNKLKEAQKIKLFLNEPHFSIGEKKEVVIGGTKFKFDKTWSEFKKKGKVFEKLKDFKKAELLLEQRLEEVKKDKKEFEKKGENKGILSIKTIEPVWAIKKETSTLKSDFNVDFFETTDGLKLAIGKDAKSNDYLRTKWARKEDLWFHLEGHKSGHLIVKGKLNFDENLFSLIGSLIRDYSNIEINEIPMVYTQVRNIKGLKGKSGTVTYTKEKYLRVIYQKNWPEFIFKI